MIGLSKAIIGLLTFLVLWGALPVWFWWFHYRIVIHLPEYAQRRGQVFMLVGAVWLGITLWLVWRFVLPDWWIDATPLITADE